MEYRLYIISNNKMTADQTYFVENVLTNEVFYAQWLGQQTRLNSKAYQKSDIENIIDYKKDENGNYWILVEGKRSPEKRLDTHFRVKFVKSMGNARPNNPKAKSHQGELPFTISEMKDVQEGCLQNETFLQQTLSSNKIQQHLKNIRYYYEGGLQEHTLLKQSRNRTVRDQCIINSGGVCYVCGFDFSKTYGEMGKGFLEVHHKTPINTYTGKHKITVDELCALCSNCHSMVHRTKQPMNVEKLKDIVQRNKVD